MPTLKPKLAVRAKKPRATASPPTTGAPTLAAAEVMITKAKVLLAQIILVMKALMKGTLTTQESRQLLKTRLAGQKVTPQLVGLLQNKPNLAPNGTSAQSIQEKYKILQEFLVFNGQLAGFAQEAEDTLRQMQAEMYKASLDIYAIASRSSSDSQVSQVVAGVKAALKLGPRNPVRQVITLEAPVTVTMPAEAVPAAQAAGEAVAGAGTVTVAATAGKKKTPVKKAGTTTAAAGAAAGGGGTGGAAAAGAGAGGTAAGGQAAPPQVQVYTPAGPEGTAPATNVPPAGGTGTGTGH